MNTQTSIITRYADVITGTLSCFDRIILQGTLNPIGHPQGMTGYLYSHGIRIFDYPRFAEQYTAKIRGHIASLAADNDMAVEFVRTHKTRKENIVSRYLAARGSHPGLVCILSAMEACATFRPWHDKNTHKTLLKHDSGKCLHYYLYFVDPDFGLCYVRVPTWLPCRLQIYVNGHNWLASQMNEQRIGFTQIDNLFTHIADFPAAQQLSDSLTGECLHTFLDSCAKAFCPIFQDLDARYHWSIMQAEYATDICFSSKQKLAYLYEHVSRNAVISVKAENVATFLGRKLHQNYKDEIGNNFNTRIEGTRIRHSMGPVSVKAYDKLATALRLETTTNDVSFFKHFRDVEKADGTIENKIAPMRKSIYSIADLATVMRTANARYLEFLSALDDPTSGAPKLEKLSSTITQHNHPFKGFNFFDKNDLALLRTIARGEFNITGFQNKQLRACLPSLTSAKATRIIKRLRIHGLIRKVRNAYKYQLTRVGKLVVTLGCQLREFFMIPSLALCN